ncbi:hypothetical protein AB0C29_35725 [Actinoplanes sp. NPDC048791]|uniref:hypothetical protein n=1 Tax=Actinoplanes sp. NPDC048791 TaxID=3154623 RepID=UPI0033FFD59D
MDNSPPSIFNFCCCFVFLAIVAGVVLVVPAFRQKVLGMFGRGTGGPLPPRLAQLAAAAMPDLRNHVFGASAGELELASELIASIKHARELLWPGYSDRAISDGLKQSPDTVLAGFENGLSQIQPRTPEVNRAIATIKVLRRPDARRIIAPVANHFNNLAAEQERPPSGH